MIKGLYVITAQANDRTHIDVAREALDAGAKIIQYREKNKSFEDMVTDCFLINEFCKEHDATFIVNDSIKLALAADADGVHLGQMDDSVLKAKEMLEGRLIGLSITSLADLKKVNHKNVDYLGVGPIFETPTKEDATPAIGLDGLKKIRSKTKLPIIAVGGINKTNCIDIYKAGINGIAVISAISFARNIKEATKEMIKISDSFIKS